MIDLNIGKKIKLENARAHVQYLNMRAAEMLNAGVVTKEEYELIVKENQLNYKKQIGGI